MAVLSIIIPAFQSENTIRRAVLSVLYEPRNKDIEIIIVDDCSTDATCSIVQTLQAEYKNIKLLRTERNSGGPSVPRNMGIKAASGLYLAFLDADDEVVSANLWAMIDVARENNADFAKGYLLRQNSGHFIKANRLPHNPTGKKETIVTLMTLQSTTQDFLVKRSLLEEHQIKYDASLFMGEDTVFILSILKVAANPLYIDNYFLKYYDETFWPLSYNQFMNGEHQFNSHASQRWSERAVYSQLTAWQQAEKIAENMGLSYFKLRLPRVFGHLLAGIVLCGGLISEECFNRLAVFTESTHNFLQGVIKLTSRYQEVYEALITGNYLDFKQVVKKRLLITGHDLKFILPVIPYLKEEFNVEIDLWEGNDQHDASQSEKLAAWADIIWCEWLLGNAVYYSRIKNHRQRLIIRAHRFELMRSFGYEVDYENVDLIFLVNYYYFEQFIKKFSIPRAKARLLSNYVESRLYTDLLPSEKQKFNIGIIGILPKRKGLMRGLELLKLLLAVDKRYRLYLYGKHPRDAYWVQNNPSQKDYYTSCADFIRENDLTEHVVYGGFLPREKLFDEVGYVLSLSDSDMPESFHLVPAEAACAGRVIYVLAWPGAEYVFPPEVFCNSLEEMRDRIVATGSQPQLYDQEAALSKSYVIDNYDIDRFLLILKYYLAQIF